VARTRIKGTLVTFKFGTPARDLRCDLISAVLEKADAGNNNTTDSVVTFCDAATGGGGGGQVWHLKVEAIQSTDGATVTPDGESLHMMIWDAAAKAGGDKIPFEFAPHGNASATKDQPHYTGSVTVPAGGYPSIGGSAGGNSWTWTYDFVVDQNLVTVVTS
jgi:hypothetical protein